jgi:cardiolipin synthase (CMP-forming)
VGTPETATVSDRVITLPNALSALRILLVPFFLWLIVAEEYGWALGLLVLASFTDWLDGKLARAWNQITRVGQLLDPVADKLYMLAALIGFSIRELVPWWLLVAIVLRELVLVGIGIVLTRNGIGPLPSSRLGKVATFVLFTAIPMLMLGHAFPAVDPVALPLGWALALWGLLLYWWSGVDYVRQAVDVVRNRPRAEGVPSDSLVDQEEGGA